MSRLRSGLAAVAAGATLALPLLLHAPHAPPVSRADMAAYEPAPQPPAPDPETAYYAQLRTRLRWVDAHLGHAALRTLDLPSRMLLAKSAADRAHLTEVGLSWRDVYGLIDAETSWVPRPGASKDGTPNIGIAQFEPATARALGVRDPEDAVEAVHAAAVYMREAAVWSSERLQGLRLSRAERARRLREGISVYYNLSWKARLAWNGRNTDKLPLETQRHIEHLRMAAQEAALLDAQLRAMPSGRKAPAVLTADRGDGRA